MGIATIQIMGIISLILTDTLVVYVSVVGLYNNDPRIKWSSRNISI